MKNLRWKGSLNEIFEWLSKQSENFQVLIITRIYEEIDFITNQNEINSYTIFNHSKFAQTNYFYFYFEN